MSNPYTNLSNISALPPSFFQNNPNMPALNLANLQQLGQAYGQNMNIGQQGQVQQPMYPQQPMQQQQQFNLAALANIPPSALDGIQLPNQMNQAPFQKQQQQFQQQQQQLQQLQQQQQNNLNNAIQPNNFNPVLQTYHRIQAKERAQENQKMKQQRLGMATNGQPQQPAQQQFAANGQSQQPAQQQFIQQMHNLARQQQGGQQMRNMNGVNMPAVIASMAAQGQNMHSQGLQLQNGMEDEMTESGRRIALQNMLHQQYSQNVSQQQQQQSQGPYPQVQMTQFQQPQPQQPQLQQPQPQPQPPQQPQQRPVQQNTGPNDFARLTQHLSPEQLEALKARFGASGNQAHAMHELFQMHAQRAGTQNQMQAQPQGQGQLPAQMQGQMQGQMQQQPNQGQLQQMPVQQSAQIQLGSTPNMQAAQLRMPQTNQPQQQQPQGRNYGHQRSESQQMQMQMQGQNQANMQGGQIQGQQMPMQGQPQNGQGVNIDPKQFEALQQMRERQQRQAAGTTPLKDANNLPMVSPQPQQYRQTPQNIPSQLPQQPQPPQRDEYKPSMAESARGWTDQQLRNNMNALLKKLANMGPEDPTRFHLLIMVSEFKRRELEVPQDVQMALSELMQNPTAAQQILAASWENIHAYAQKSANTSIRPPASQRQVSMTGSQGNPIEIVTPKLANTAALPQAVPGHQRQASFNGRRWAGMDFRDEPLPVGEGQIWDTLKKLHRKNDLVPPHMDGRPIDIYALLNLVHRNGGSSKVDQNPAFWQYIGAHLGFGGEEANKSSPQVASELRRIWGQYLSPFEEAWYGKVLASRSQRMPPSQPMPQIPQQMLELAAKNQGSLSEQQRQMMDTARKLSNAQLSTPGVNPGTPLISLQNLPQAPTQPNPAMAYAVQSLRGNPGLCQNWIKSKEENMRAKFPNTISQYADVPEHQRSAVLGELRSLAEAAKDAQTKMPKYLLVAAEKGVEEFSRISTLIQLYMIIILSCQQAEQGRFCYPPENIERLKYQLASLIISANTLYEETRAGPEGIARVERLLQGLPKSSPRESTAVLAANLPKGLRVEDLKPPPSKRAKGKNSPAAPTPEAKTPSHIAESPIATSSPAARKPNKRKRTNKEDSEAMAPPPAPPPVEVPSEAELELAQSKAFFKARSDLEQGEADIWAALAKVVEEYNAATEPPPDFFPKWIDASQLNELPTPELYMPEEADTSPESIKTVATQVIPPVFSTEETWEEKRLIDMSPSSAAYNGGLFWDEYDYDFGVTV